MSVLVYLPAYLVACLPIVYNYTEKFLAPPPHLSTVKPFARNDVVSVVYVVTV